MTSFQSDEEAVSRMSSFERVFTSPHAGRVAAAAEGPRGGRGRGCDDATRASRRPGRLLREWCKSGLRRRQRAGRRPSPGPRSAADRLHRHRGAGHRGGRVELAVVHVLAGVLLIGDRDDRAKRQSPTSGNLSRLGVRGLPLPAPVPAPSSGGLVRDGEGDAVQRDAVAGRGHGGIRAAPRLERLFIVTVSSSSAVKFLTFPLELVLAERFSQLVCMSFNWTPLCSSDCSSVATWVVASLERLDSGVRGRAHADVERGGVGRAGSSRGCNLKTVLDASRRGTAATSRRRSAVTVGEVEGTPDTARSTSA